MSTPLNVIGHVLTLANGRRVRVLGERHCEGTARRACKWRGCQWTYWYGHYLLVQPADTPQEADGGGHGGQADTCDLPV